VAAAVEELLRHTPLGAGAGFIRIATEDIELGGVTVREGEGVMVAIHSANRDESVFDDADALRLDRAVNPHIGFGHGPHHCLGAQLARMELQVAMSALMREFPELALATAPEDVEWKSGGFVRGPEKLMVTW
jgi:cytochrome P450